MIFATYGFPKHGGHPIWSDLAQSPIVGSEPSLTEIAGKHLRVQYCPTAAITTMGRGAKLMKSLANQIEYEFFYEDWKSNTHEFWRFEISRRILHSIVIKLEDERGK